MSTRKIRLFIKAVLTSAVPAIFVYLGTDNNIVDVLYENKYIGDAVDIGNLKHVCSIIGGILSFILITYQISAKNLQIDSMNEQINGLLYQNKHVFETAFSELVGKNISLDVRIFVPVYPRISSKKEQLYFMIKNYDGLCDVGTTNNLKFKVYPEEQKEGLVGECYNRKAMIYDDNLKCNNSTRYGLSSYQISKTRELEFSIVCPLYDNNSSVVAIIAIDGREKIDISTNETAIINSVLTFSQFLYENDPGLFKPIRRLL